MTTLFLRAGLPLGVATAILCGATGLWAQDAITACDTLAASPFDDTRPAGVAGVDFADIDAAAALAACTKAQAASPQDPRILFQLGRALQASDKMDGAKMAYTQSAELGFAVAMVNLGVLIEDRQSTEARDWYGKAAALNHVLGHFNLAVAYRDGIGGPVDAGLAVASFEKALALNDGRAAFNLAVLYDEGLLLPRDLTKALSLYKRGVALGDVDCIVNLAIMTEKGEGVPADKAAALALFEQAAALGDTEAAAKVARLTEQRKTEGW